MEYPIDTIINIGKKNSATNPIIHKIVSMMAEPEIYFSG